MRPSALLAFVVFLSLAGCLQAVEMSGKPDGSLAGKPDGSQTSGPDASEPGPDGGICACASATDCPSLEPTDVCAPEKAVCKDCQCLTEPLPRVWDNDPGACQKAADCDCQDLLHGGCLGAFQCDRDGRCLWVCGGCSSDLDCRLGEVCQEVSCGQPKQCIAGCRDGLGCKAGTICGPMDYFLCGEPYGQCLPEPGCSVDSDCPAGSVCDFAEGTDERACQTGCHQSSQCAADEQCAIGPCPECMGCACIGQCEKEAACASDADCGAGQVCGTDFANCSLHCLPGCRGASDCRPDQYCSAAPPCMGCGCDHGTCQQRQDGCTDNSQCATGEVCAYDDTIECTGTRHCERGCLQNADCLGGICQLADCGPCCPGWCAVPPAGCTDDSLCPDGYVCEPGPSCQGPKTCVPGCRVGGKPCPRGQGCQAQACLTCPCPDLCEGPEPVCPMSQPSCDSALDCTWWQESCVEGCCLKCPLYEKPLCPPYQCVFGAGTGPDGCQGPPFCAPCCTCPDVNAPVCGTNYQTYPSAPCEASCAGAGVLHQGACEPFEGMDCMNATCAGGQYCRDACPTCDMANLRCTLNGACLLDSDCPAGNPPPIGCANPTWKCEADHTCSVTCP